MDERRRAAVWEGNGFPDLTGADSLDVLLLEVPEKDVFRAEEGVRGQREYGQLGLFGKFLEDRFAWQTSPLDGVSMKNNSVKRMCRKKKDHLINEGT